MNSLGVIETRGLTAAIQAADAACKAANVEIIGYRKVGSGLVSVCFQGEISAVKTAIDHGVEVVSQKELVIGSLVIARPEPSIIAKLLIAKHQKKAPITAETVQHVITEIQPVVIETTAKKVADHGEIAKEIADPLTHNVASETQAVTDNAQNSKKEIKPEGRKGKK